MNKPDKRHNEMEYPMMRYKCPLCDASLDRLEPMGQDLAVFSEKRIVGGGYRKNAKCPICYSTDRERLIYLYLLKKRNFFNEKLKTLHIAPEGGLSRKIHECTNIDYLTADISASYVMVNMDITEINYPDEMFDVIICNHVLEHIIDDGKAMRELYRVLKHGGWGILQVPISLTLEETYEDFSITDPAIRESMFGQSDHVRIYAMDYLDRLKNSGFEIDLFNWEEDPEFFGGNNKYGLLKAENVFIVNKP